MKRIIRYIALLCCFSIVFSICSYAKQRRDDDEDEYSEWQEVWGEQKLTMSDTTIVLYVKGDSEEDTEWELSVEMEPNEEDITWTSSNKKVATVTSKGVVKAKGKGSCTITATGDESEKTATCSVEVLEEYVPVEEFLVRGDNTDLTVAKGKTVKLPINMRPADHSSVPIYAQVEDSQICSVSKDGIVRGNNEGETEIIVWIKNLEKGESQQAEVPIEDAEFKLTFYITVTDYNVDKLKDFSKEYEGFTINTRKDAGESEYVWVEVRDVGWILFDASTEKFCKEWIDIGRNRYYLEEKKCETTDAEGKKKHETFYVRKTGWYKEKEKWYLFGTDGLMQRGWAKDSGKWYYLDPVDGVMETGKLSLGGKQYWLLSDGSAVERWYQDTDGKWYYGNPQTCEIPDGWFLVDGIWYYADPVNYNIITNDWVMDSDGSYYYLQADGSMLIDGVTPDGFIIGTDGRWVH